MEKLVAGFGMAMTIFFFAIVFFFGFDYVWGLIIGLGLSGLGYIFCEE